MPPYRPDPTLFFSYFESGPPSYFAAALFDQILVIGLGCRSRPKGNVVVAAPVGEHLVGQGLRKRGIALGQEPVEPDDRGR